VPGASSVLEGETIKFWAAEAEPGESGSAPGTVVAVTPSGIEVAAKDSVLRVTELQRAGGKRLAVADFLRGFDVKTGQVFG